MSVPGAPISLTPVDVRPPRCLTTWQPAGSWHMIRMAVCVASTLLCSACGGEVSNSDPSMVLPDGSGGPDGDAGQNQELVAEVDQTQLTSCSKHSDCSPRYCDPETHKCVDCINDDQCSDGYRCVDKKCVEWTSCAQDADCEQTGQV